MKKYHVIGIKSWSGQYDGYCQSEYIVYKASMQFLKKYT